MMGESYIVVISVLIDINKIIPTRIIHLDITQKLYKTDSVKLNYIKLMDEHNKIKYLPIMVHIFHCFPKFNPMIFHN